MVYAKDIAGKKFGRLTALKISGKSKRENVWRCKCECGKATDVRLSNLTSRNTQSCGCLKGEK